MKYERSYLVFEQEEFVPVFTEICFNELDLLPG
jgi:hypothetical protein